MPNSNTADYDVIVIGAGLSGLICCETVLKTHKKLQKAQFPPEPITELKVALVECHKDGRVGGRIYSRHGIDLGATWMWLGGLSNMIWKRCKELDLQPIPQEGGREEFRVNGGMESLVVSLFQKIRKRVDCMKGMKLKALRQEKNWHHVEVKLENVNQELEGNIGTLKTITGKHVVLAFAPKKVLEEVVLDFVHKELDFRRNLIAGVSLGTRIRQQPIWMGVAGKLALFYKKRFWVPKKIYGGLYINVDDDRTCAIQAYDAGMTAVNNEFFNVLVVFLAFGDDAKDKTPDDLAYDVVIPQLAGDFDLSIDDLTNYSFLEFKSWKEDMNVTSDPKLLLETEIQRFPTYPSPINGINSPQKYRRIWFCGSEASAVSPGMLEGAAWNGEFVGKYVVGLIHKKRIGSKSRGTSDVYEKGNSYKSF